MTQLEECLKQGKQINEWKDFIDAYFYHNYDSFVNTCRGGVEERWFILPDRIKTTEAGVTVGGSGCFRINAYSTPLCGFITEFADSEEDLDLIAAEDGDQYPMLDYDTPEDILQAMLDEIEG